MSIVFAVGATVDLHWSREPVYMGVDLQAYARDGKLVWNIYYESNIRESVYRVSFCLGVQIER